MEIKTKSDVSIRIVPEGSSRILLFDQPVRILELGKVELTKLSALLASDLEMQPLKDAKAISHE
jgi:hypothetical protein